MAQSGCHALLAGINGNVASQISPPLRHCGIDLHRVDWSTGVLQVISGTSFDIVITSYPRPDYPMFLQALRHERSLSRGSRLLVMTTPEQRGQALDLLDGGVDRVVLSDGPYDDLIDAAANMIKAAPRFDVRSVARLTVHLSRRSLWTVGQTENLSASGMLIRGWCHYPSDTPVDFELRLQSDLWVRGVAAITRSAQAEQEGVAGFAARFIAFERNSQAKLRTFLEAQYALDFNTAADTTC